jgi:hypothetical protein
LPIKLEFEDSGPDNFWVNRCWREGSEVQCVTYLSYKKSDFEADMQNAQNQLNCICGLQDDPPCGCSIKVKFSDNPDHFFDSRNDATSSNFRKNPANFLDGNCTINCDELIIYLNYTDEFIGDDPQNTRFFFSSSGDYSWQSGNKAFYPLGWNLNRAIGFELFFLAGLGYGNKEDFPWEGIYLNDNDEIFESFPIGEDESNEGYSGMSSPASQTVMPVTKTGDNEKCSIGKLYCSNLVPSGIEKPDDTMSDEGALNIIVNGRVNILKFDYGPDKFSLIIHDIQGREVYRKKIDNFRYEQDVTIELPNGLYFCRILSSKGNKYYKLLSL